MHILDHLRHVILIIQAGELIVIFTVHRHQQRVIVSAGKDLSPVQAGKDFAQSGFLTVAFSLK